MKKLGKGCCIVSLGFGRVVTFIDVVLVARMDVDIVDLGGKYVSFEEGFDFVIEEATEDLQDG